MAQPDSSRVEVASFTTEQAGEPVMWQNIWLNEDRVILGCLAYARISKTGAEYTYQGTEDLRAYGRNSITGFENAVQLAFNARPGVGPKGDNIPNPYITDALGPSPISAKLYDRHADQFAGNLRDRPLKGLGQWTVGEQAILANLKERFTELDGAWLYSIIYYHLALLTAEEDILADPQMHDETERIKDVSEEHVNDLLTAVDLDLTMSKNLSPFGNVPADQLAGNFTVSRRKVHEAEVSIAKHTQESPVGGFQLRVGWRPGGRTWPYMDPTEADERKAFGRELHKIKGEDARPALHELDRELEELGTRVERAVDIRDRLGMLAAKEAAKAKQ